MINDEKNKKDRSVREIEVHYLMSINVFKITFIGLLYRIHSIILKYRETQKIIIITKNF